MTSWRQFQTNRLNALRSTGPRTEDDAVEAFIEGRADDDVGVGIDLLADAGGGFVELAKVRSLPPVIEIRTPRHGEPTTRRRRLHGRHGFHGDASCGMAKFLRLLANSFICV